MTAVEQLETSGRSAVLRRCWANPRLRRVLAAYLLFNIAEWANWIALLVWAYDHDGVRGSSSIALVQLDRRFLPHDDLHGALRDDDVLLRPGRMGFGLLDMTWPNDHMIELDRPLTVEGK